MPHASRPTNITTAPTASLGAANVPLRGDVTRSLYDVYYERYCLLYNLYGAERRQLDRSEYERMDQELLRLIEKAQHSDLAMAEITRIKEIEYLLLDDIAEGFYS